MVERFTSLKRIFLFLEVTIRKMKRQVTEWEEKFAIHTANKQLIPRLYKEQHINGKQTNRNIDKILQI